MIIPLRDIQVVLYHMGKEEGGKIRKLTKKIAENGGTLSMVGGAVRDIIHQTAPRDFDFLVTGLTGKEIRKIANPLGKFHLVGKKFPIYKLHTSGEHSIDITCIPPDGRDHYDILFAKSKTRDFTINSLSINMHTGEVYDPLDAVKAVCEGRLEVIDPRSFSDDDIRLMRAIQLSGRLEYTWTESECDILIPMIPSLDRLARVGVFEEWKKLLLSHGSPSYGLQLCSMLGIYDFHDTYTSIDSIHKKLIKKTFSPHETLLICLLVIWVSAGMSRADFVHFFGLDNILIRDMDRILRAYDEVLVFFTHRGSDGEVSDRSMRKWAKRLLPLSVDLCMVFLKALPKNDAIPDEAIKWLIEQTRRLEIGDLRRRSLD